MLLHCEDVITWAYKWMHCPFYRFDSFREMYYSNYCIIQQFLHTRQKAFLKELQCPAMWISWHPGTGWPSWHPPSILFTPGVQSAPCQDRIPCLEISVVHCGKAETKVRLRYGADIWKIKSGPFNPVRSPQTWWIWCSLHDFICIVELAHIPLVVYGTILIWIDSNMTFWLDSTQVCMDMFFLSWISVVLVAHWDLNAVSEAFPLFRKSTVLGETVYY